jgi:ParB family chromosome partitioning protein
MSGDSSQNMSKKVVQMRDASTSAGRSNAEKRTHYDPNSDPVDFSARAAQILGRIDKPEAIFADYKPASDPVSSESAPLAESSKKDAEAVEEASASPFGMLDVNLIQSSPYQTRDLQDESGLAPLVESIRQRGVLQAILVRQADEGFELIAGERRLRAAIQAGLTEIPAFLLDIADQDAAEISVIENAQRANLNPIEEALAFKQLISSFKINQTELARIVGRNRSSISNTLRLLQLDDRVQEMLTEGELSAGHGRALLTVPDADLQYRLARRAVRAELSVHALDKLLARMNEEYEEEELSEEELRAISNLKRNQTRVSNLLELEQVDLRYNSEGNKKLTLTFDTEASWRRFMAKIRD